MITIVNIQDLHSLSNIHLSVPSFPKLKSKLYLDHYGKSDDTIKIPFMYDRLRKIKF